MNKTMTSRERVLAAVKGLPVDRIPVMYWLNPHATCRLLTDFQPGKNSIATALGKAMWKRLDRHGGMDADALSRILPFVMEEYGNSEYALDLGADIAILSPGFISPSSFISSIRFRKGRINVRGPFGGTMALAGIYMHPFEPPIVCPTELAGFQFPDVSDKHFSGVRKFKKKFPDACVMVEIGAMQQVLCDYILGSESFMLALYDYPDEIRAFMERIGAWLEDIIHLAAGAGADIIFLQDDYGFNNRPLISMKMWDEITFPGLSRLAAASHAHALPFMLHSCGFQMPFLERYVEAGVDILQSLQVGAGNDLAKAFEITKGKLTFATGIDVQRSEGMSPDEISQTIQDAYNTGSRSGKFILAMTHMMQHSFSADKFAVIFEKVRQLQEIKWPG
jgi:uroporphyrinogen-III decarboxylase